MTEKERLLKFMEQEVPVTLKVLQAYPEDKLDLKPHDKSNSAKDLFKTFIRESNGMLLFIEGVADWSKTAPPAGLEKKDELIAFYEQNIGKVKEKLAASKDEDLEKNDLPFGGGGMTLRRQDAVWFLAYDMIHHRGQMTVYIRLAGGLVPAVYGPSADDRGGFGG